VDLKKSTLHQLTPTGGRSSGEEENTSLTFIIRRLLMFTKTRIEKDKRSSSGRDIMAGTKDGELSILTNLSKKELPEWTVNMDSISIDHSSSDPDFQCRELWNLFHGMLDLEDITKVEEINRHGDSTEFLTPLET
jgi:hypothetical protein